MRVRRVHHIWYAWVKKGKKEYTREDHGLLQNIKNIYVKCALFVEGPYIYVFGEIFKPPNNLYIITI